MAGRFRNVCFTVNNPTPADRVGLISCYPDIFSYMVFGEEVGQNGTPHLQGYAELVGQKSLNQIKRISGLERAHIEKRHGSAKQAADYCKKDGNFQEFGTISNQGARTDICEVKQAAKIGGMRLVSAGFKYNDIRLAEKYLVYHEPGRDPAETVRVRWYWGAPGVGKSLRALTEAEEVDPKDVYHKKDGNKWWDGYDGHKCVIIDDFRDSWWPLTYMLGLIDRYPFKVECKGGSRQMRATEMWVTSVQHPETMYSHANGEPIRQLIRRVMTIAEVAWSDTDGIVERFNEVHGRVSDA